MGLYQGIDVAEMRRLGRRGCENEPASRYRQNRKFKSAETRKLQKKLKTETAGQLVTRVIFSRLEYTE
jgi:hypothetical protein